jgi:hypothetical protein
MGEAIWVKVSNSEGEFDGLIESRKGLGDYEKCNGHFE